MSYSVTQYLRFQRSDLSLSPGVCFCMTLFTTLLVCFQRSDLSLSPGAIDGVVGVSNKNKVSNEATYPCRREDSWDIMLNIETMKGFPTKRLIPVAGRQTGLG